MIRQQLLVPPLTGWLSPNEQFVTNCVGERLPCNYLYVSSVSFMSATA